MILRSLFLFILFTQIHFQGNATNNDSLLNNIFSEIYNLQFQRAEVLLANKKDQLDPFYFDILKLDLFWWKYSNARSKEDADNLNNLLEEYVKSGIKNGDKIAQLIGKSYQLRYARKKYNFIRIISLRSEINQFLSEIDRNKLPISGNELYQFDFVLPYIICIFRHEKSN